jgi:ubiquinone/menaquinone biosynthesis C-methylase UbiE
LLNPQPGETLLDIGCGDIGWLEKHALSQGCKMVVGLDINGYNLRKMKVLIRNAEFILGSAIKLPFRNECIDKIALLEVLEHLPQGMDDLVITECYRILRDKGDCLISVPKNNWIFNLLDPYSWFRHVHRKYNVNNLANKVIKNGFKIKILRCEFGFITALLFIFFYFLRKIPSIRALVYNNLRGEIQSRKTILSMVSKLCELELRKPLLMRYNIFLLANKSTSRSLGKINGR